MEILLLFAPFFPIVAFALIFLLLLMRGSSRRLSLLTSSVVWATTLVLITEGLSCVHRFSVIEVAAAWGTLVGVLITFVVCSALRNSPSQANQTTSPLGATSSWLTLSIFGTIGSLGAWLPLLVTMSFVVAIVGLTAIVSPPNNGDSLIYHLARVVHWIQNCSVAHYPTNILHQLCSNPWSEFVIANFQILSGGDRFANLAQTFSWIGCMIGGSMIASELGATKNGQILSSIIIATIPMAILQASSTQNDLVVSYWLVCFVYCCLRLIKQNRESSKELIVLSGATLGLALLTKGTAYLFAAPFVIWLTSSLIRRCGFGSWRALMPIATIAIVINACFFMRNVELFGSVLDPFHLGNGPQRIVNETISWQGFVSNLVRNLVVHLGTGINMVNLKVEKAVMLLCDKIGISINDPSTTFGATAHGYPTFAILICSLPAYFNHEDIAGNLLHCLMIIIALVLIACNKHYHDNPTLRLYAFSLLCGFFFFSLCLKWQMWTSRLQLPLFVLWSPAVALVLCGLPGKIIPYLASATLLLMTPPWLLFNRSRPIATWDSILVSERQSLYYRSVPELEGSFEHAASVLKSLGEKSIGLIVDEKCSFEYLLWVSLRQVAGGRLRIEHVNVTNPSNNVYDDPSFAPFDCRVIICLAPQIKRRQLIANRKRYLLYWSDQNIAIYKE